MAKKKTSEDARKAAQGVSTLSVHGAEPRRKYADSLTVPIVQTSTYIFHDEKDLSDYTSGKKFRYEYLRYGNPTVKAAEDKLALLEGAEAGLLFASGMSAVTSTLFALLSGGDHIVITGDCYKKTRQFVATDLGRFGVQYDIVSPTAEAITAAIKPNTKLIFTESPTNPYLYVIDLVKLVAAAKKAGVPVIIDSTFATPYNQKPIEYGVDMVIHSATKYLSGHNDIMAGAVLGNAGIIAKIKTFQKTTGGNIDPHCAWLLIRGLKTFALRVDHQNRSALAVAKWLEAHPKIARVWHPGLASHPCHKIAKAQMKGCGGCFSFEIDGNLKQVQKFLRTLEIVMMGPSLGGTESLITHPATVTYYDMTRAQRAAVGITDQLCRLSVGVEDTADLIADLEQALAGV